MIYSNSGHSSFVPVSRTPVPINYTYEVVAQRAALPLTLSEVKEQLNIPLSSTIKDSYLTFLIEAVTDYFESFTNRILINTGFRTYRDKFPCCSNCFIIRKAKVDPGSVLINYLKNSVLTPIDPLKYYVTSQNSYPGIYLNQNQSWPNDVDIRVQAIQIDFTAGFGANESSIPAKIKLSLLQHIAALDANRGDCDSDACANALPSAAKNIYMQYKVAEVTAFKKCRGC